MTSNLHLSHKEAIIQDYSLLLMISIQELFKGLLAQIQNAFSVTMQTYHTAFSVTSLVPILFLRMASAKQQALQVTSK